MGNISPNKIRRTTGAVITADAPATTTPDDEESGVTEENVHYYAEGNYLKIRDGEHPSAVAD